MGTNGGGDESFDLSISSADHQLSIGMSVDGEHEVISDAAIVDLIAQGRILQARALFQRAVPSEPDWIFFDGRVAKAKGDFGAAERAFREAIRLRPSHLSARRELAHTLLLAGDLRGAEHHFRTLLRTDPDAEYRRGYIRLLRRIDHLRPFSVTGHFALVSSSNINRGSSESEFVPGVPDVPRFDITSRAEGGTGLEAGIAGRYRVSTSEHGRLTADAGLFGRKFDTGDYDNATLSARLRFGEFREKSRWTVGPLVRATISADDNDSVVAGLAANYEQRIAKRLDGFVSAIHQYRWSLNDKGIDAPFTSIQTGIARPIKNGTVAFGPRLVFFRPEERHQRYDGQALFSRISRSWRGGLSAELGVEVGKRRYADDFPLAGEPRKDTFYQITLTAQHEQVRLGRFMPTINCILGATDSNIAFFEHSVQECSFGVTTRL
ncbi:hypothetical protein AUC45_06920 [Erythrobacter sp. YT30]|nr:hypothetical protein AUC45_06920 [Erythrobacter sp. YT30]